MKKGFIIFLLISIIVLPFLSGCAATNNENNASADENGDKVQILTTLFVTTDFSQKIGGAFVEVTNLVPPGTSPHDFEPSAKDMAALVNGDMFVYNGAGMEGWVEKVKQNLKDKHVKLVNASERIELIESAHHHDHDADEEDDEHEEHGDDHAHAGEMDPHVWLDPMNALKQAEEIKNALVEIDPAHGDVYEANFQQLKEDLIALDQHYKEELKDVKRKEFFVSHAAFGYMAKRYDLIQRSISGIIPADEPSPSELAEIVRDAKEMEIKYILLDPQDVTKISEVVAEEIGAETDVIYTIGNLPKNLIEKGYDYVSLMEQNLTTLKKALNE